MLNSLVSPLRFGVLFALVVVLAWRWLPKSLRVLAAGVLAICLLLMTPVVANGLIGLQEDRGAAHGCVDHPASAIVVLGGGIASEADHASDYAALTDASLRRLFAAVELQHRYPDLTLVVSGGASRYARSESGLLGALAVSLGVPAERLRLEEGSLTTWQNARFSADLQPPVPRDIFLVTSAVHMPRARYAFEQAGFTVCPRPTDYRYAAYGGVGYLLPSTSGLAKADIALHELVGEAAYRLGWLTDTARDPHRDAGER